MRLQVTSTNGTLNPLRFGLESLPSALLGKPHLIAKYLPGKRVPWKQELVTFYREIIRLRSWEFASESPGLSAEGDGKTSAHECQNPTFLQDESQGVLA